MEIHEIYRNVVTFAFIAMSFKLEIGPYVSLSIPRDMIICIIMFCLKYNEKPFTLCSCLQKLHEVELKNMNK